MTPTRRPWTSARRAASTTGGRWGVDRRGVHRVVAADDRVQQRRVEHGARARAGLVEAGGQRHEPVAGDPAIRRLDADRAGDGGGLADRAAGVRADRQRRLVCRDDGAGATTRAAGDAGEVPGVVGGAVGRVLGGGAHRELVHVGLAQDRHTGGLEAAHDGGVVGRQPALEDLGAAGRRQALGDQHVLDGDGHAGEDVQLLAGCATLVDGPGGGERPLAVDVQVGVDVAVDGGDPVEVRLHDLHGAELAGAEGVRQLGSAETGDVGVHGLSLGVWSVFGEDAGHGEALLLLLRGGGQGGLRAERRANHVRDGSRW